MTDVLRSLGFEPSRAEPSIYMRPCPDPTKDIYKYVASYVDDLTYVISDPEKFLDDLRNNKVYNFDLKGSGEVNFHLGCRFVQDCTGVMCMDASRYVDKMCDNYSKLFPGAPIQKQYRQPLETNDHPELDVTAFFNKDKTEIY